MYDCLFEEKMTWLCMCACAWVFAWAGITSLIMAEGKFTPSDFRIILQCNGREEEVCMNGLNRSARERRGFLVGISAF